MELKVQEVDETLTLALRIVLHVCQLCPTTADIIFKKAKLSVSISNQLLTTCARTYTAKHIKQYVVRWRKAMAGTVILKFLLNFKHFTTYTTSERCYRKWYCIHW